MESLNKTSSETMPVLFIGHGSPLNAIEDNEFSLAWLEAGSQLPKPRAILCISAHWQTYGLKATAMDNPGTIYDFFGFPGELYKLKYPAPGSPELVKEMQQVIEDGQLIADFDWGLDHGAWSVLRRLFPEADVPVVQLSLDYSRSPEEHYALGRQLKYLRHKNVIILGSGNIVHNLRLINWESGAYEWALEFDEQVHQFILSGNDQELIYYQDLGQPAHLSIPTDEHYLPLLYILAARDAGEQVTFFADQVVMGSISMRSIRFG